MKTFLLIVSFLVLFISCSNPIQHKIAAERYLKENNYEDALIEINKAIQSEPDSLSFYVVRAFTYAYLGKYKEEIVDLDKMIAVYKSKNIKFLYAYNESAIAKMQLGLYNEALTDIDYFIDNSNTYDYLIEGYLHKANIFYKMNDSINSNKFYRLVLTENKGKNKKLESLALVGLANLSKSPKDALKLLNEAIILDDKNAISYGARGRIYFDLGILDKAHIDFIRSLSLDVSNAPTFSYLGQLLSNFDDKKDSAIICLKKAIQLAPESKDNYMDYMNLAVLEHRSNNLEEAYNNFKKAESINTQNDVLYYNFALLLSDMNKNNEALDKINKAININSKDGEYFDTKGNILSSFNNSFNESEIEYRNSIKVNPKNGSPYYNLGLLYDNFNKNDQAILYYDKAVILKFDLKKTLVNRALVKIRMNKIQSAIVDLKKAYCLGRTDVQPLIDKYCNYKDNHFKKH